MIMHDGANLLMASDWERYRDILVAREQELLKRLAGIRLEKEMCTLMIDSFGQD